MDGMGGMGHGGGMAAPPPKSNKKKLVMHMEFFWGTVTEVLFENWPGTRGTGHYILALVFVFVLAIILEWVSRLQVAGNGGRSRFLTGLLRTAHHTFRMGLAYLVMLAIMSFNGGVFLAIVAGHAVGFLLFGARLFGKAGPDDGLDRHGVGC